MKKKLVWLIGSFSLGIILIIFFFFPSGPTGLLSPQGKSNIIPRPLEKYYFENLRSQVFSGSEIKLERVIKKEATYTSWLFSFTTESKKVTGMANIPKGSGPFPVVVMLRGYADEEIYFTGLGTRKAAGVFAENGFLTLAPDFLGFGGSDKASEDILEARFERPITVLELLASIKNLPTADEENIFLWGHSNGGQIALSVLEISRREIPTTLWAPVSKGFPESVLAYIGDSPAGEAGLDDKGMKVKNAIDKFLEIYDSTKISVDNFWGDINAPIQIHQGGKDTLVPKEWSDSLVENLRLFSKEVTYFEYPQSDHNLTPDWDLVVKRDIDFFRQFLDKK